MSTSYKATRRYAFRKATVSFAHCLHFTLKYSLPQIESWYAIGDMLRWTREDLTAARDVYRIWRA